MKKLLWQSILLELPWNGEDISEILEEKEFLQLTHGKGYANWEDNYFCIIEQQLGENLWNQSQSK